MAFLKKKAAHLKANLAALTAHKYNCKYHFTVTIDHIDGVPGEEGDEIFLAWRRGNSLTGETSVTAIDEHQVAKWDSSPIMSMDVVVPYIGDDVAAEKNLRLSLVKKVDGSVLGKVVVKLGELVAVSPEKELTFLLKFSERMRNHMPSTVHLFCKPTLKRLDGRAVLGIAGPSTDPHHKREVHGQEYEIGGVDEDSADEESEEEEITPPLPADSEVPPPPPSDETISSELPVAEEPKPAPAIAVPGPPTPEPGANGTPEPEPLPTEVAEPPVPPTPPPVEPEPIEPEPEPVPVPPTPPPVEPVEPVLDEPEIVPAAPEVVPEPPVPAPEPLPPVVEEPPVPPTPPPVEPSLVAEPEPVVHRHLEQEDEPQGAVIVKQPTIEEPVPIPTSKDSVEAIIPEEAAPVNREVSPTITVTPATPSAPEITDPIIPTPEVESCNPARDANMEHTTNVAVMDGAVNGPYLEEVEEETTEVVNDTVEASSSDRSAPELRAEVQDLQEDVKKPSPQRPTPVKSAEQQSSPLMILIPVAVAVLAVTFFFMSRN